MKDNYSCHQISIPLVTGILLTILLTDLILGTHCFNATLISGDEFNAVAIFSILLQGCVCSLGVSCTRLAGTTTRSSESVATTLTSSRSVNVASAGRTSWQSLVSSTSLFLPSSRLCWLHVRRSGRNQTLSTSVSIFNVIYHLFIYYYFMITYKLCDDSYSYHVCMWMGIIHM